ncbi:MAG: hypothetical protein WCW77_03445 [Patescibacteria group bacterium]|jgi:hypothetical protein
MAKNKLARNNITTSTQSYLDISEIRDNTLVMKDGTMRAVIMVSSLNFALKSDDEQNAIVAAYVSFLNNIEFPLQIVIQSRELNIENYMKDLGQRQKEQTNELLKIQTAEYIQYVKELISIGKIMSKHFYIIVPYNPLSDKQKAFFPRLMDVFRAATLVRMKDEMFFRRKVQLDYRAENIIGGLMSMGLNAVQLDTQGLIELLYNTYNPETSSNEKLVDTDKLRIAD